VELEDSVAGYGIQLEDVSFGYRPDLPILQVTHLTCEHLLAVSLWLSTIEATLHQWPQAVNKSGAHTQSFGVSQISKRYLLAEEAVPDIPTGTSCDWRTAAVTGLQRCACCASSYEQDSVC
jgi:hypothetical protein